MCNHVWGCDCDHSGGVYLAYGDRTAPTDQRTEDRYTDGGRTLVEKLFMPLSGIPLLKLGAFRETSPFGKRGLDDRVRGRVPAEMNIEGTREAYPLYFAMTDEGMMQSGRRGATGSIDPWGSAVASQSSWTPGGATVERTF